MMADAKIKSITAGMRAATINWLTAKYCYREIGQHHASMLGKTNTYRHRGHVSLVTLGVICLH